MQQQNNNYTGWKIAGHGAEAYERYIVPAWMGAWARHMVQAARIEAGDRVLDMACGTAAGKEHFHGEASSVVFSLIPPGAGREFVVTPPE